MADPMNMPNAAASGYQLALDLMQDLKRFNRTGECFLDPDLREGRPHRNLVSEYLDQVRMLNSEDAEETFAAMITEFLASAFGGAIPTDPVKHYRKLVRLQHCTVVARSDQSFQRFIAKAKTVPGVANGWSDES